MEDLKVRELKVRGLKVHNKFSSDGAMVSDCIICCTNDDHKLFEVILEYNSLEEVVFFGALTHVPTKLSSKLLVSDVTENNKVKMHLFRSTKRGFDKVPLWIFKGPSAIGKSFVAHLTNLSVFETDAYETLPELILEDIVVLGNKYPHTVKDVVSRTKDRNVILNNFSHYTDHQE